MNAAIAIKFSGNGGGQKENRYLADATPRPTCCIVVDWSVHDSAYRCTVVYDGFREEAFGETLEAALNAAITLYNKEHGDE